MEIEKAYFTLPEILVRWNIPEADLIYLAENDRLRLSVRVFGMPIEFGDLRASVDDQPHSMPSERKRYSGLLDLHAQDAFRLFRSGELALTEFRTPNASHASVRGDESPVLCMIGDLVLRREERDRFEAESGFSGSGNRNPEPAFAASSDYQTIRCNGQAFHLGLIQAQVVRLLHEAAHAGSPWINGKSVLTSAGARSLKMSDVFKSQPGWRDLIRSNRRGLYRLACD
ncbi:MAG: hypothetical protein CVT71_03100 [Alphaproteobacteria bacterium HGW-Alphaproteobacteria-10]|nr:MAG: hypothetical protein CVT71_03100 [Alphaproteobacteria bacterium HGW-Alphaproteobacteria-10]